MSTKEQGDAGEEIAATFLRKAGYTILERNWRYFRLELDIIALKEKDLVVVEVKTRSTGAFGPPEEFLTRRQQSRIVKAAHEYVLLKQREEDVRFDVIAITGTDASPLINHFKDAFYPGL